MSRNKIGFKPSWMQNEVEEEEMPTLILNPITPIVVENQQVVLSPAHTMLLVKIRITESVIASKKFFKLSLKKKMEVLEELKWLTAMNVQLGGV